MRGVLLVIEGSDASGKATQSKLLVRRLEREGFKAKRISFPRYGSFFGGLVKKYLHGEFGSIESIPVEAAALLYALDRYDAKPLLEKWLSQGKIVVCDRYTASNAVHQGAKLSTEKQRAFIKWLNALEGRLPRPSVTVYLDVPPNVAQGLMKGRKRDLHEKNLSYLESVRKLYLKLAFQSNWIKIECVEDNKLLSVKQIHEMVWSKIKNPLKAHETVTTAL